MLIEEVANTDKGTRRTASKNFTSRKPKKKYLTFLDYIASTLMKNFFIRPCYLIF